jgi:hypothetical protein
LPRSSRAILKKMKPSLKRGIMQVQTLVCSRRTCDRQPIGAGLNRNLGSPAAPGEVVEADLNRLIERRSRQKDPDEESAMWRESVKAYEEQRRQMARAEWHLHHTAQAERLRRTLEGLIAHHEEHAAKLMDVRPKGGA